MSDDGALMSAALERQIVELIRRDRRNRRASSESDDSAEEKKASRFPERAMILNASLAAASNSKSGATSAKAQVCVWVVSEGKYKETALILDVFNHSESTSFEPDTFGFARFIDGHWCFFGDCSSMGSRGSFAIDNPSMPPPEDPF